MSRHRRLDPNPDVDMALRYGGAEEREWARSNEMLKRCAIDSAARRDAVDAARRAAERRSMVRFLAGCALAVFFVALISCWLVGR